jgi:hypothetical protein
MKWWQALRGRPFYWVLDGGDPAASYYMLRYVVERPGSARAVRAARLALSESEPVGKLKARLRPRGEPEWGTGYGGPLWALRLLAEWGHPGDDEQIASCLDWALDGAASHPYSDELLLHAGAVFGFSTDDRVEALIVSLLTRLRRGDVAAEGVALAAMALAALPAAQLATAEVAVVEKALAGIPVNGSAFTAYACPTYDNPDVLTLAESALRLGLRGAWLEGWVQQIVVAQDEQGFWRAARVYPPATGAGVPNRWVSAKALYVLRAFYGEA